jgi:hypothetical protein
MNDISLGVVVGIIVGILLMSYNGEQHTTIIEKGYGLYCPQDGNFAFAGECK